MPVSVLDVADWLLTLSDAEEKQLEHMQLQRLCCYAQGFALALYGDALFGNPIEVAEDGPMVREVWDSYGGCDSVPSVLSTVPLAVPTQGIAGAVRFVYERFTGDRSAAELAALAPQEPPWALANCRVDHSPCRNRRLAGPRCMISCVPNSKQPTGKQMCPRRISTGYSGSLRRTTNFAHSYGAGELISRLVVSVGLFACDIQAARLRRLRFGSGRARNPLHKSDPLSRSAGRERIPSPPGFAGGDAEGRGGPAANISVGIHIC